MARVVNQWPTRMVGALAIALLLLAPTAAVPQSRARRTKQALNGTLFVLIDDQPPKLQFMAVNTTNGVTMHYYDVEGVNAIPPHPSAVDKIRGVYYAVVENATAPVLPLIGVDVRRSGAVVTSVSSIHAPVWGLEYDHSHRVLLAGCSDALHTYSGAVNVTSGNVAQGAITYTGDMAFALAHTLDEAVSEYWIVMRGLSNNTNYLIRQRPYSGGYDMAKVADGWFIADLEWDLETQTVYGVASQMNATESSLCPPARHAGDVARCRAQAGSTAPTTYYGILTRDGEFKPLQPLPQLYIFDAFSSAIDLDNGIFFAFGAHVYDGSSHDGWNVVLSIDLRSGELVRASDAPANGKGFSVVAGAWGIQYVPDLVAPCCDDDA